MLFPGLMLIEIGCSGETTRVDLKDGTVKVGGDKADEIRIPGLPPSLLELRIDGKELTLTSREAVCVGKSMFPSHVPRLVVAGEVVKLARGVTVKQVPPERAAKNTAVLMKELLAGTWDLEDTQASTLTVLTGADAGSVIPLAFEQILIGRSDDCEMQIRDPGVSRRHARLVMREQKTVIEDLRGHNGTFVNGVRIRRRATLVPGDVIEMGKTLLRYDAREATTPRPPSPPSVLVDRSLVVTEPHMPKPPLPRKWLAVTFAGAAAALIFGVAAALSAYF